MNLNILLISLSVLNIPILVFFWLYHEINSYYVYWFYLLFYLALDFFLFWNFIFLQNFAILSLFYLLFSFHLSSWVLPSQPVVLETDTQSTSRQYKSVSFLLFYHDLRNITNPVIRWVGSVPCSEAVFLSACLPGPTESYKAMTSGSESAITFFPSHFRRWWAYLSVPGFKL